MWKNYFLIALRNLKRSLGLSLIKITGLGLGICGCLIVFLLVRLEYSYDHHHSKGDRIYRVYTSFEGVWAGLNYGVPLALPDAFRERATGVEAVSQMLTEDYNVIVNDNGNNDSRKTFPKPNRVVIIDSSFFKVFTDYKWIYGSPEVLSHPNAVVLTESKAKTYFGKTDLSAVVGARIIYRDSLETTVAGIVTDPPANTDFNFTDFISLASTRSGWMKKSFDFEDWESVSSSWLCMVRFADETSPDDVAEMLSKLAKEKDERTMSEGVTVTTFTSFLLQPLSDIHFNTNIGTWDGGRATTPLDTMKALTGIAVLLLLVAVINFVNLETAQALRRAREVGVRKVMGGTRSSLVTFFISESFVITFISVMLSLPLAKLSLIFFSEFLPAELTVDLTEPGLWLFLASITIIVTVLSGAYPAMVLSSYQPVQALKFNNVTGGSGSAFLRKVLTVFQFIFSQALIIGALVITFQIAWMLDKDMGFTHDAVVNIQTPWWEKAAKRPVLRNELEQLSEVDVISQNSRPPAARGYNTTTIIYNDGKADIPHSLNVTYGDTSYVRLFDLELIAGRNIQPGDSLMEIVVNETYGRKLNMLPADLIGKDVRTGGGKVYHIVGVLRDFHHASMHKTIGPWFYGYNSNSSVISVRLAKGTNGSDAMSKIKEAYKKIYGDTEMSIAFMDESIQKFYESERRISKLANTATALAIFISCLGLFGLASFTAIQRTKEIGIRKVLGASVSSIVTLLSKEFILLVMISFVIAAPVAWYAGDQWLNTFPYRMDLAVWIFVVAGAISVLVALITVGFQAMKAAVVNPVDSLRCE